MRVFVIWGLIILGIVVLAVLKNRSAGPVQSDPTTPAAASPSNSNNVAVTSTAPKPDFQKLKGKWLRPDGGYVIEITSVDDAGKLSAAYFNPQPIHVARAEATYAGGATKVFIELRDVNYPGSTYTLTYIPDKDLLVGIYYQALQQQSFEVYFERMR
jgi:hypothetical protein